MNSLKTTGKYYFTFVSFTQGKKINVLDYEMAVSLSTTVYCIFMKKNKLWNGFCSVLRDQLLE